MAEAVISGVVRTLGNFSIEEGEFLLGVKDQANQLHEDLKRLQWFLKDADTRQSEAERVRDWVSQTRDLAYEAENLLEHYAFKVESRRGRGIIKRCIGLLDELLTRHQVGSNIKSLKAKITCLTTNFRDYGIREIMENRSAPGGSSSREQQLRRSYSHIVEEDLVGQASQVEMLAAKLIGENHRVVSLWGMGGLGKTTLAKQVYHHPEVRRNFKVFCWVCVSQEWQMRDLLQEILTKFMPEKRELIKKGRDEELVRLLFKFQQNEKCLVVLDDIWSLEAWESIKVAFPIREEGSKVLLTTRNETIARQADASGFLHQLPLLNDEESWELLKKKSLIERCCQDPDEVQRMVKLGKQMVVHCGGLPLGIHVLGGILSTKNNLTEWEKVHKYIKSYLGKEDNIRTDQGGLQNILTLSYNDLPYQLKHCFLYLSKYKEDVVIETKSLYQIWMAEGLISMEDQLGDEPIIDIAERYMEELTKRSMVFVEMEEDVHSIFGFGSTSFLKFKSCRLHDIMRELCLRKAKEENFIQVMNWVEENGRVLPDFSSFTSPRLALTFVIPRKDVVFSIDAHIEKNLDKLDSDLCSVPGVKWNFDLVAVVGQIRRGGGSAKLLSSGWSDKSEEVKQLEWQKEHHAGYVLTRKELIGNLRSFTSSFVGWSMAVEKIMQSLIDDFNMLRVLSIEGIDLGYSKRKISVIERLRLSSAIGELIQLRYLSFRDSGPLIVPSSIGKLQHLQTLDLRCGYRLEIPNAVRKLKRLKHLYIPISSSIRLDGLQSLEILEHVHNRYTDVRVISSLKNLLSLKATIVEKLDDVEEIINHANNLICLRFLSLRIKYCNFSLEEGSAVLRNLFTCNPLTNLEIIAGRMSKLPEYEPCFSPNLHSLELWNTKIQEDPMRTLQRLPKLRNLRLYGDFYMGEDMICRASGFPRLKVLLLRDLRNLKNCCIEGGAMPNLSCLGIAACTKLNMIPDGLRFLRNLKELRIARMPEEFKSRLQVKEDNQEGEDFDKARHVPSIIFE